MTDRTKNLYHAYFECTVLGNHPYFNDILNEFKLVLNPALKSCYYFN